MRTVLYPPLFPEPEPPRYGGPAPVYDDLVPMDPAEARPLTGFHARPSIPDLPLPDYLEPVVSRYDRLRDRWAEAKAALAEAEARQRQIAQQHQLARVVAAEREEPMPKPPADDGAQAVSDAKATVDAHKTALDRAGAAVNAALVDAAPDLHFIGAEDFLTNRDRTIQLARDLQASFAKTVESLRTFGQVDRECLSRRIPSDIVVQGDPDEPDRRTQLAAGQFLREIIRHTGSDLLAVVPQINLDKLMMWLTDQPVVLDKIVVDALTLALSGDAEQDNAEADPAG